MAYRRKGVRDIITYNPAKACQGYTLFAPMSSNDAWLIDMEGRLVHHWTTPFPPAQHGRLLPNGHLLWPQKAKEPVIPVGGTGSEIVELDWDGKIVWRHEEPTINHDVQRLDNGNTLFNVYVEVPKELAARIQGGVPNSEAQGRIYSSALKEIDAHGKTVWEWRMYEHLDPIEDAQCPLCPRSIWGYINSLCVMRNGNILCTFRFENQVAIIEKKTGKILWRSRRDLELGHPHCVTELDNGNILLFDNGTHRRSIHRGAHELAYSRVIELNPKTDRVEWMYKDPNVFNFYSSICGGCQRLPNGNTLICESTKGRFFEVTPDCEIVWEYQNPFLIDRPEYWGWTLSSCVFQCHRYPPDYPGLKGKTLDPFRYEWTVTERVTLSAKEKAARDRLEKLGY